MLLESDFARFLVRHLAFAVGGNHVLVPAGVGRERGLGDDAAVDEGLEIDNVFSDEFGKALHVPDAEDAEILLRREQIHHAGLEIGSDHDFGVILDDEFSRFDVAFAIERDRASEGGEAIGLVGAEIRLGQSRTGGYAARIVVLYDDRAWLIHQIAQDVERVVGIGDVRLAGMLAGLEKLGDGREVAARLYHLDVAENEIAVHELVKRGLLTGILAVSETLLLAADVPRHLLVRKRLAVVAVDERNLHFWREMIGLDRSVSFF